VIPPSERDVQAVARQIAALGAAEQAGIFGLSGWTEKALNLAMANPAHKTQLFRFVDVFPACHDSADIMRHIEEYFGGSDGPALIGHGLGLAVHLPLVGRLTSVTAHHNITRMAHQFIAGATPEEAVPQLTHLWQAGAACTVDLLGEKTITEAEADRYASRVLAMFNTLILASQSWPRAPRLEEDPWGTVPRVNVSVKATALSPLFGPLTYADGVAEARQRLRPILERARDAQATVHLDMEDDDVKDMTLDLLRQVAAEFPDGPQLGCVIQAYRKDSHTDLLDLLAWSKQALRKPLQIRLVKGAYWDYETIIARAEGWPVPVFEAKEETDANYERCTRLLVDHAGDVRPAIAGHNLRSIAYAIAYTRAQGLPDSAIELQVLYGMAEPIHVALRNLGLRVRVYAPVGDLVAGMAYLVRRLLENTSNESFIHQRFAEERNLDSLVQPPQAAEQRLPEAPREPGPRAPTDAEAPGRFANEPRSEFRRPEPRAALQRSVRDLPRHFGFEAPVLIGGRRVRTPDQLISVDPGDFATIVCRSGRAERAEVDRAIEVALRAQQHWAARPWQSRAQMLFDAAAIMRRRRAELASLEVFEAGKPQPEADADVCEAIDFCEYYGREALELSAGAAIDQAPGESNVYRYRPLGLGAVIAPWNFPLAIPTGMVAAALVTGNAVLFKPAEQTPGIAYRLVQIFIEAGLPSEVLAFLPGVGEDIGAYLVEHPATAFVTFTGSKAVGLEIVRQAAVHRPGQDHVKRVVAEMGGKNAIIVDSDADLDQAVPAIVASAFSYAGQKCSAASRVIAVGRVFDELVHRLVGAAELVRVGHPRDLSTTVGPLIDADALERVKNYQAIATTEGDVVLQRTNVPNYGWYTGPTIVVTDSPACRIATEEIFGPVLTLMSAHDFEHALALANDSEYALTGGLFSRSPRHIHRAANAFRAGNLYINRAITGALVARQPFGGYGLSGVGSKAGGPDYLRQFVEPWVVTENTIRQGFAPSGDQAGDWRT
jgi:RHH-type proline utilization regulon transcriptional repressor/proline dehydrogenase/delta 1-pyrroline-5-carboxylate dehydrogenase